MLIVVDSRLQYEVFVSVQQCFASSCFEAARCVLRENHRTRSGLTRFVLCDRTAGVMTLRAQRFLPNTHKLQRALCCACLRAFDFLVVFVREGRTRAHAKRLLALAPLAMRSGYD